MAAVAPNSDPEKMEEAEERLDSEPEEEEEEIQEGFTVQVGDTYSCRRQDGTYHDAKVVKTRMNKRAGREEYYVHYAGLHSRQNEWVDKTRLMLIKSEVEEVESETDQERMEDGNAPGDQETSENGNAPADQETSENGNAPGENQSDDDEPQAKKIKVEVHEAPANSSVIPEDLAEELTCPMCTELFKDPVVIACGHNFCRSCIDEAWEGEDTFACPECEEVVADKRYTTNRILANLVKKTTTASPAAKSAVKEKIRPPENCLVHDERLKLFCKDDGDLGCVICRESLKHDKHNFLPILDAVGVYRTELSNIASPLEEALKVAEAMAKQQSEKIEKHMADVTECREHIEAEFEKMHRYLREREEKLLAKLQEEGDGHLKEMEENIAKMQQNIESIKESIAAASEKLGDTESISFLTDIKSFITKCQEQKKEALSSENKVLEKKLSKDLYMVPFLTQMFEEINATPEVSRSQPAREESGYTQRAPLVQHPYSLPPGDSLPERQDSEVDGPPLCHSLPQHLSILEGQEQPKEIWIVGNFWVTKSAQVAKQRAYGTNLGFDEGEFTVRWLDKYDMLWRRLVPYLDEATSTMGTPSIVFIHLGSCDLVEGMLNNLIPSVKRDLRYIANHYQNTAFIWSHVLPRREWLNPFMEEHRSRFNIEVSRFARNNGIQVAQLREVERMIMECFSNRVNHSLTDICHVLNMNLITVLELAIDRMKLAPMLQP